MAEHDEERQLLMIAEFTHSALTLFATKEFYRDVNGRTEGYGSFYAAADALRVSDTPELLLVDLSRQTAHSAEDLSLVGMGCMTSFLYVLDNDTLFYHIDSKIEKTSEEIRIDE